jgi:ABC-type transport system involved in Fe-S cluster assembly fused permease/ATPase subunit
MAVASKDALIAAYSAYPAAVFIYFVVSSIFLCLRPGKASGSERDVRTPSRRGPIMAVLGILVILSAVNVLVLTLLSSNPVFATSTEYAVVGQLSCVLVFGVQLTYIYDIKWPLWHPFQGSWVIALLFEVLLQCLVLSESASDNRTPASDIASAAFAGMKCLPLVTLVLLTLPSPRIFGRSAIADTECQPLLCDNQQMMGVTGDQGGTDPVTYGSMSDIAMGHSNRGNEEASHLFGEEAMQAAEDVRKATGKGSRFADGLMVRLIKRATASTDALAFSDQLSVTYGDVQALTDVQVVLPHIWPVGLRKLHLRLVGILFCIITTSACNVLIPRQVGIIIDILITKGAGNVWIAVALLVTMRLAISASGLETLCQWLWSPVSSYMTESMTRAVYSRMMHQSADFHESWSTSRMFLAIHGASAMSSLASCLLLGGFPLLIDIVMAGSYISLTLGFFEGLITTTSGIIFFLLTSRFVTKAASANRPRKLLLQKEHSLQQHGLMTWYDSSVLNQLGFEDNRHSDCVTARHVEEKRYSMAWAKSTAARTLILAVGLLATAFCAVYRVRTGQATPGQGAMLLAYWFQLSVSLAYMATLGVRVTDDLEDAEKVVEVMNFRPTYGNQKGARPLKFAGGSIQFDQVSFRYNSQKTFIHDFSLKIQAGQTVLVVGPSGAGKSTLLKLICRLRDATGGTLRVNDQDVRDVDVSRFVASIVSSVYRLARISSLLTSGSLRDRIGVVPQAPVLFDDSIMNNVRYGRITASDEEVYEACKAACIHHRINEFVEGLAANSLSHEILR